MITKKEAIELDYLERTIYSPLLQLLPIIKNNNPTEKDLMYKNEDDTESKIGVGTFWLNKEAKEVFVLHTVKDSKAIWKNIKEYYELSK